MCILRVLPSLLLLAAACSSQGERAKMTGNVLPPCPGTPNCVSTMATDRQHAIAPIAYSGSAGEAMTRLLAILNEMPRTEIVSASPTIVQAVFTTRLMRYKDDGMFVIDDGAKVIHFRSASRVGRSDLGVNRRRMEQIRRSFGQ